MKKLKYISVFLFFFLFAFLSVFNWYNRGPVGDSSDVSEIYIEPGDPLAFRRAAYTLKKNEIIKNVKFFLLLGKISGADRKAKGGYYTLSSGLSTIEIIRRISDGSSDTITVTIKEGFDIYDTAALLTDLNIISNENMFIRLCESTYVINLIERKTGLQGITNAEGFLYPDTYRIKKGSSAPLLIELALENFIQKYKDFLKENNMRKKFIYYLKVASLVEKETALEEERGLVAGVLYNRLKVGEKLRYDPSIIYAMKKKGIYRHNLTEKGVRIRRVHFYLKSQFNTYYTKGLPPHPICSPTVEAMNAAVKPAETSFMFFVAKDNERGEHAFSITYDEHLSNIQKYQLSQK